MTEQEGREIVDLEESNGTISSGEKPMMNVDEYRSVLAT